MPKCFVCKKEIDEALLKKQEGEEMPRALHCKKWPGDQIACTSHHGIFEDFHGKPAPAIKKSNAN